MGEKEKLLSKLTMKDYRGDLEFVLDGKKFDEEAKNLLLNVYYKLDSFYKDYKAVKIECEDKNDYLEDYIKIIKSKCKNILLVKPKEITEGGKFSVNKKTGEIKCIPNELVLLNAIFKMIERDVETDRLLLEDFTKICLNKIIYKSKTINSVEPLRDFTGWSWQIAIEENDNIINNLIYQNLVLLLGYKFVNENIYKSNIVSVLSNELNKKKYGENGYNFLVDLLKTCIIAFNNSSKDNHDKCFKYKKSLISKSRMLSTRKETVEDTTKSSSEISKQIKKIDDMLDDIVLLREEFGKEIKKNKKAYIGISDFVVKIEEERADLLVQIKENNRVLNQKQYLFNHDDYNKLLDLYEMIDENEETVNIQNQLLNLQKDFLECMKIRIQNAKTKNELCEIIVELRYYSNLLIKKGKTVIEQSEILKEFEELEKQSIYKMVENKYVELGFKNLELNYEILKYIFKTKMIDLSEMTIKISYDSNNRINVEYYDGKMMELKQSFDIPNEDVVQNKKDRKDKKIKVFKIGG